MSLWGKYPGLRVPGRNTICDSLQGSHNETHPVKVQLRERWALISSDSQISRKRAIMSLSWKMSYFTKLKAPEFGRVVGHLLLAQTKPRNKPHPATEVTPQTAVCKALHTGF